MIRLRRYVPALLVVALVVLGGAGCSKQARKARYLAQADQDFKALQYDKAEVEYLNALQVAPLNPVAIGQLGIIYYEQGRLPQAYAYLQKAAELETNNIEVRLKLGLTYLSVRKLKEAQVEALWVLGRQPGREEALLLLAGAATTAKEVQETRQRIEKLRQQDSDKAGYHSALGALYFQQKDVVKAESEFTKALALDPKSSAAYAALGSLYLARNDLKLAEPAFKASAELSPLRSVRQLKYVDFKLQTGAVAEAKKMLEDITQKAPDYLPAWTRLMQVAFAEKKYPDCAALIKKVLARDARNYEALLLSGNLKLVQGEGEQAIAEFQRLDTIYKRVPQVQYQLALAYLLNKDTAKAIASLNQAITLNPDYPEAILVLAELNIRKGNPAPAIASLTQLVKQHPQIAQAHLLLANAYLAQKNPDEAVAVYNRMMGLFPKNPQIPLFSGMILSQQNKRAEARKAFEKTLELAPDFLPASELLVDLDLMDKQYATALERVKKLMEKDPKAAGPQLLLAKIHLAQNDLKQGETDLLKAIELDPGSQTAYLLLAQLYVTSNKHQQALERLNGLVARTTNDVSAIMMIGMIQDGLTNYPAARDAYEKVLTINPQFSPALNNLAYIYSEKLVQLDKALGLAEQARQLNPNDFATEDTLGWILFKRGEYPRALGLLQESAGNLPTEPEVQFHLGMTHYMMGEEDPARLALQRAVESKKDFPGKEEGRRRLATLAIDSKTANATVLAALEKGSQADPNDLVALNRLAAIYERDGAADKAVKTYEATLKRSPKNASLMLKLAQLYSGRPNDQPKALELAKTAHNLSPEDPYISHTLSRLVYQTGDYKWALSLVQDAALKLSNQPDLLYDLAWSYYSVGRVADAEATLQATLKFGASFAKLDDAKRFLAMIGAGKNAAQAQAAAAQVQTILKAEPSYVPALMSAALLQEQQTNYPAARQLYDQALARYPLFAPATRQLAMLYAQHLGDDTKAYELALKARDSFPQDADLAKTLGILAYRRNDYARSVPLLVESARQRNTDAELMYYLGMAQYRLKDRTGSKASLQRALDLKLSGTFAGEAKKILTELK